MRRFLPILLVALPTLQPALAVDIDFDHLAPGDPVSKIAGVVFSSPAGPLVASGRYATTSPPLCLGVGDGAHELLLPADRVTLAFPDAVTSVTARFVSTRAAPKGAFRIESVQGVATSSELPDAVLPDGAEVYSVRLATTKAFLEADLVGTSDELFAFNVDDIAFGNDVDADGVLDPDDNCRDVPNPDQADANAPDDDDASLAGVQHYGDACDVDLDDDGIVGPSDFFGVFRPCLGADLSKQPECAISDLDGDGGVAPADFFARLRPALGTSPGPGVTDP